MVNRGSSTRSPTTTCTAAVNRIPTPPRRKAMSFTSHQRVAPQVWAVSSQTTFMSHSARRSAEFVVSVEERDQLVVWSRGSSRLAVRARIVLACAQPGVSYDEVAAAVGVSPMTVRAWRQRFVESRLAGLRDKERPGRPKADLVLSDAEREQL